MTTKTAQFTPGPWIIRTHQNLTAICTPKGEMQLSLHGVHDGLKPLSVSLQEWLANAHLIAAAPAMYEALKALHSVLDQRMPDGRTLNQHLSQEVFECFYGPAIAARAAIAKAEGA